MSLKPATVRSRKSFVFTAASYRIPLPVREILLFENGDSYPICPRCGSTVDREYMHFCDRCGQRLAWESLDSADIVHAPRRCPR